MYVEAKTVCKNILNRDHSRGLAVKNHNLRHILYTPLKPVLVLSKIIITDLLAMSSVIATNRSKDKISIQTDKNS